MKLGMTMVDLCFRDFRDFPSLSLKCYNSNFSTS